jgi:hypothetical protein
MTTALHIQEIPGTELSPWLDWLGELRIRVFREYPYLYDGILEYEREYLRVDQDCADSRIVLVTNDRCELIGATTGSKNGGGSFGGIEQGADDAHVIIVGPGLGGSACPEAFLVQLDAFLLGAAENHAAPRRPLPTGRASVQFRAGC